MELTAQEQAELTNVMSRPGYEVIVKVFEDELRKLEVAIYSIKDSDSDATVANRARASKAAAVFYTAVRDRLEREAQLTKLDIVNEEFEDISSELLNGPDLVKEILNEQ
jgi:hypothetical protein